MKDLRIDAEYMLRMMDRESTYQLYVLGRRLGPMKLNRDVLEQNSADDGDCRTWTGKTESGRPVAFFPARGRKLPAQKVAWEMEYGLTTAQISSTCGNPLCVNKDHLDYANSPMDLLVA